ncbi:restriction endonuclease subunit S [Micromonospora sp. C32]|uniref:restriction endonuclease subunit S n=1 Tax=unclassified Micromonospora TaxID=2617518 RepID=UPI001B375795|nr:MULTISPECIES: restriction endonuclease subunit S [unclassified Micromonospora]MBQ1043845.1 restriction endonuclease subunit S [Micromonospora sp. C72]MBQ1057510.1 restriction endonuclease subunit S [Micromonospora sp. C32]
MTALNVLKLADIASINPKLTSRPADDELISFVPMSAVDAQTGATGSGEERSFGEVSKGYTVFSDQDVLVAKITPCFENGKIAQAGLTHRMGVGSTEFHVIRPNRSQLDVRYLLHFLRRPAVRAAGERRMTGSAGQRRVPEAFLAALAIPVPPLPEQKRIAEVLDRVGELRTKRQQALACVDGLTQSIFVDMFGNPHRLHRTWKAMPLEAVCTAINDCPHSTPRWTESGEICLRTSNLTKGGWDWTDTRFVSPATFVERSKRGSIEPGDIVLSREGTVGIAAIVEEGMRICMGQRLVQVRPQIDLLTPKFLLTYLLNVLAPERIASFMVGSTSRHLNVRELKALRVPLPPVRLQQQFAARAQEVDRLRGAQQRQLVELDGLFASLQDRAFRGLL